jgi:hypothetical protein
MSAKAYAPARNAYGTKEVSFHAEAPSLPAPAAQPTQLADQQGGTPGEKAVSVLGAPIHGDRKWKAAAVAAGYGAFQSRGLTRLAFLVGGLYALKKSKG